jgi:hypothetical protein
MPRRKREKQLPPFHGDISGKEENRKALYSIRPPFFMGYSDDASAISQIRMIFPGFKMSLGSSARLMLRITETASPCSATRKSILP